MPEKIIIGKETFKALSSAQRVSILKTLDLRNHTQSELAEVLKLSAPTVKEHLAEMENAGLVKKLDEGRKWKYFSLTEKGKCVLYPERRSIWIVLSFLAASIAGTIWTGSKQLAFTRQIAAPEIGVALEKTAIMADAAQAAPVQAPSPFAFYFFGLLTAALLLLLAYYYSRIKKGRRIIRNKPK